ncbi:hypothetical protein, partial [Pseudomonas fluorescens]
GDSWGLLGGQVGCRLGIALDRCAVGGRKGANPDPSAGPRQCQFVEGPV